MNFKNQASPTSSPFKSGYDLHYHSINPGSLIPLRIQLLALAWLRRTRPSRIGSWGGILGSFFSLPEFWIADHSPKIKGESWRDNKKHINYGENATLRHEM